MIATVLLAVTAMTQNYDALIDDLAADKKSAANAQAILSEAGTQAFPALLKRINDPTIISNQLFQEERVERTKEGSLTLARPRIGRVAFQIIQYQIEGAWPKGFREHYAINETNVSEWLKKHAGLSITQLQIRACADSLDSVTREIEKQGVSAFRLETLSFLHKRLGKILEDAQKVQ